MKQKPQREKIRRSDLIELLMKMRGGNTFIGMMTTTIPRMKKGGNPFWGKVKKTSNVAGCLLHNYEADVNRQREREEKSANFVVQAPTWGTRIGNSCVLKHTKKSETVERHYIDFRLLRVIRARLFSIPDGKRLPDNAIDGWKYDRKKSGKQNLRREIILNRFDFSNIRKMNIGLRDENGKLIEKKRYEVVDDKQISKG